jgi:hypothetical protein
MFYTKAQAQVEIVKLVNTFAASEARLQNEVEAQIENNFIRPLFEYLNWNTHNIGLSGTEYEFLVQKTDRYGKRPDYILQLDGQHLLVMDAKQVKYAMHDPRWLNQVYAYAYSTQNLAPARKIDFAVLTDFQEFIVLDCTLYAGDPKALPNFRVLDWRYPDYVTHFETLWELFERENLRAAARTRNTENPAGLWARQLSPKKVKANRIPPDKTFLAAMDDDTTGWRVRLAKDMKKRSPQADGDLITAAVQLLINWLIFVKVLSDREIEDDYLARLAETVERDGLAEDATGWFTACRAIFEKLNTFYNGSVFEPRPELEAVSVSNKVVRNIIHDLQPENSPYNFAMLPVEILGTIYERFLGRVVRTTEKQVKIEDKPEVRKAGGVYYTPQYIVAYIVKQTVGQLLETCRTPDDVAKLKILDPACGSGSFLLGAYTALLDWYVRYYSDKERLTKKDRAAAYYDADGGVRLTAKLKRQILLDNLFGVDIDAQAVEVTRFSLSLKALEETRHDELLEEWSLFKMTVLPDLRDNIKCGNSLIGNDYFANQLIPDMAELKRVNPFDWTREFSGIMANGGFDAVIGNPPYVRQESLTYLKEYFQKHYQAYDGVADLYVYFIEKGLSLLREGGLFSIIVSSSFLRATYGKPLRKFLSQDTAIIQLVDFGGLAVFENAKDTYVCIPLLGKFTQPEQVDVCKIKNLEHLDLVDYVSQHHYTISASQLGIDSWTFDEESRLRLFQKIMARGIGLGEYVDGKFFRGVTTGLNEAFVVDTTTKDKLILEDSKSAEIIKPLLQGEDVRRWEIDYKDRWLIFTRRGINIDDYSAIKAHLNQWKEDLTPKQNKDQKRGRKPGRYKWYEIQDDVAYYSIFEGPKIIFPDIAKEPRFYFDPDGHYLANTAYALGTDDLYLLGILNSKLFWFAISKISIPFGMRAGKYRYRLIYQYMKQVPIRTINFSDPADKARHDNMVQLVAAMLELHKRQAAATTQTEQDLYQRQIDATDRQIDHLVYALYGLTEAEIRLVEIGG